MPTTHSNGLDGMCNKKIYHEQPAISIKLKVWKPYSNWRENIKEGLRLNQDMGKKSHAMEI